MKNICASCIGVEVTEIVETDNSKLPQWLESIDYVSNFIDNVPLERYQMENPNIKLKLNVGKKNKGKLIWFHGASVGEIQSIIPLIEKFEKNKKIKQILITSNTVSSSLIIKNLRLKKTIHQFFPIDCNFISKKFKIKD